MKNYRFFTLFAWLTAMIACQAAPPSSPTAVAEVPTSVAAVSPALPVVEDPLPNAPPTSVVATAQTPIPTSTAVVPPTLTSTPVPLRQIEPLDSGRIRYSYAGDGFALTVPANWSVVDYIMIADGTSSAGALSSELISSQLFIDLFANGGVRFYAVNTGESSVASTNPANILLIQDEMATEAEFDAYLNQTIGDIQQNLNVIQGPAMLDFPAGAATGGRSARLDYALETVNPLGEELTLILSQVMVWKEGRLTVVTGTSTQENSDSQPQIDEIFASLMLTR